ncbi:YjcZ family sporulation protein [Ureibacillus sinduriensis]|nr:YjcZ family sporulation protein [Ureibacillus sinduriensis]
MGKHVGGEFEYSNGGNGSWFALLVVLFILLIIVGAYYFSNGYGY